MVKILNEFKNDNISKEIKKAFKEILKQTNKEIVDKKSKSVVTLNQGLYGDSVA